MAYKYEPVTVLDRAKRTANDGLSATLPGQGLSLVQLSDCDDIYFVARCWGPGNPNLYAVQFSVEMSINGTEWAYVADFSIAAPEGASDVNMAQRWLPGKLLDKVRIRWQNMTGASVEFDMRACGK